MHNTLTCNLAILLVYWLLYIYIINTQTNNMKKIMVNIEKFAGIQKVKKEVHTSDSK